MGHEEGKKEGLEEMKKSSMSVAGMNSVLSFNFDISPTYTHSHTHTHTQEKLKDQGTTEVARHIFFFSSSFILSRA
jgi:hypothetical protein